MERLLSGRVPGLPRLGFSFVDVRDVADLHIRAMTAPEAAGQRFIAAGDFAWMADLAALLRARLGDAAQQGPDAQSPGLGRQACGAVRQKPGGRGAAPR